jgi:hypothetical protein
MERAHITTHHEKKYGTFIFVRAVTLDECSGERTNGVLLLEAL